ncbi:hypothetical protein PO909_025008 [Leuciscus waleckii]
MPPLLSSLSTLVMFLRRQQHSSFLTLSRASGSAEAWRLLCHSSLALLILYNRHRECEVAKLTIQDYRDRNSVLPSDESLSPFERHVLCHLTRVGVLGKRGRVQPLILPPHSEECLDLLLKTSGDEGEKASGAATKRLEDFLQREYHVTQSCARIGQDPALMNRVGRVVLYGEREGVLFRGMSLQHICLELDVMSGNSADSFSEDSDREGNGNKERAVVVKKRVASTRSPRQKKGTSPRVPQATASPSAGLKRRSSQVKSGKRGVLKRPWSEAERVAVETHLKRNIVDLRVPAKADCERCLQLCPLLASNQRDWRAIKFYCHNRIQLLRKQGRRDGNTQ